MRPPSWNRRRWSLLVAACALVLAALGLLAQPFERPASRPVSPARSVPAVSRARPPSKPARDPVVRRRVYLGRSVLGRPIYAVELGDPDNERRTLAVGVIHGNEPAGIRIADDLISQPPPREALLWIIRELNPDGVAAGTRQNAHGVDLNRNFPWRWRPLGSRGYLQYSGPRPLSEPEAKAARSLILRVRPQTTIWFHQPLGLVDESGGRLATERRFARLTGLPLRRLIRYPGSAVGWQNHRLPHTTAFVVELPPGTLSSRSASRYADAVLRLAS